MIRVCGNVWVQTNEDARDKHPEILVDRLNLDKSMSGCYNLVVAVSHNDIIHDSI